LPIRHILISFYQAFAVAIFAGLTACSTFGVAGAETAAAPIEQLPLNFTPFSITSLPVLISPSIFAFSLKIRISATFNFPVTWPEI
jgi:hypothetical protein